MAHLLGVAPRLVAGKEPPVTSVNSCGLVFPAALEGGHVHPAVLDKEFDQPVTCGEVGRVGGDQLLQGLSFRFQIALLGGEPGRQLLDLCRIPFSRG